MAKRTYCRHPEVVNKDGVSIWLPEDEFYSLACDIAYAEGCARGVDPVMNALVYQFAIANQMRAEAEEKYGACNSLICNLLRKIKAFGGVDKRAGSV